MAEGKTLSVNLELIDKLFVRRGLEVLRQQSIRSRGKEMPGSDIYQLRTREIESITKLLERFV